MGNAIEHSAPLAIGIALSPIPIIAVLLMLTSRRARVNGLVFVAGWLAGLAAIGAVILSLASRSLAGRPGGGASWLSWAEIVLAILVLAVAAWQFRSWPRGGGQPPTPGWMSTIDKATPVGALGLGAVLSGANPKNLVLAAAGATAIIRTGVPGSQQAIAYAAFGFISTLSVGILVLTYLAMGERSVKLLLRMKDWMTWHGALITIALCLIIAAKLLSDGVSALSS
jgi:Sap, sulfolipid-1-addressing protein